MDVAVAPNYPMFLNWLADASLPPRSLDPRSIRFLPNPQRDLRGCNGNTIYVINSGELDPETIALIESRSDLCRTVWEWT